MGSPSRQHHLLFLDGFGSTSDQVTTWIEAFQARCVLETFSPIAFGYRNPGEPYEDFETYKTPEELRVKFIDNLPRDDLPSCALGYSLGADVALLGTASHETMRSVSRLILVAPAFQVSDQLVQDYTTVFQRKGRALPPPLVELTDPEHELFDRLVEALMTLATTSIRVDVLYSSQDGWCPFQEPNLPEAAGEFIKFVPLPIEKRGSDKRFHQMLKTHAVTIDMICQLLGGTNLRANK